MPPPHQGTPGRPPRIVPGRERPRRGRGSIRRGTVERLLTDMGFLGDTVAERNDARARYVRESLQQTGMSEEDILAVISDLPSYGGWEIPPGNVKPWAREV